MKNKITISILSILFCAGGLFSQPVGAPNGTIPPSVANSSFSWFRGGNTAAGTAGPNNIFGTAAGFNSGIYTMTNGINRTRLNGMQTSLINGVSQTVDGYFGIGPNGYFASNTPASMLHLQGPDNSGFGSLAGWRAWMKTGTFTSENSDALYVGMKQEAGTNRSDAVVAWSDDGGAGGIGADKLRFIFTNPINNPTSLDPLNPLSLPGYEYMRLVSSPNQTNSTGARAGNVGIGPVFTDLLPPTNRLHVNAEENLSNFVQITNQNGTNQTINDGLHVGYAPTSAANKEAVVNQKENDRLSLYANNGERIRIMQIGALNNSIPFNPGGLPTNLTRVSISEDPTTPVTRPLSLLHLGYNTVGAANDGWRPWMDVGMFVSKFSDNVYLGLKAEPGVLGIPGLDRHDAVLNWGDNQTSTFPTNGPDNLRFIFTSNIGGGAPPANSANGLETGRFYPGRDTLGTYGRFGVGDFTATGVNQNPTHKIDVVGNGRFRFLPDSIYRKDTLVQKIVFVDSLGVLRWEYADSLNLGQGGNACGAVNTNPLTSDWELPMNDFNYHFSDGGSTNQFNNVGIGTNCNVLTARLEVINPVMTVGIDAITSRPVANNIGIRGEAMNAGTNSIGILGQAQTAGGTTFNTGVFGVARNSVQTNYAGQFFAAGPSSDNYGVNASAGGATVTNFGVNANSSGGTIAYGVRARASLGSIASYALYGSAAPSTSGGTSINDSYAGFFDGDVYFGAGTFGPSDATIKQNIDSIQNAMAIINQLKPKTFEFNPSVHPEMNLPNGMKYGLLAQDVETILPTLVNSNTFPATYDTAGVMTSPSFQIKGLEYQQLIPILIKGMQEQNSKIDSLNDENDMQDSINTSLQNQINQLAALINSCCSSHSMQQNNNSNNSIASQDVNLKDGQAIVLEQNVPNPFAEQTTINYFLPDNVVKAQILFYNAQGKLIQSVDLNEKGKGSLNVFASDLSNGIYTYTLVVDGKVVETKKMVKQQ